MTNEQKLNKAIKARLEHIRKEIRAERVSLGEIAQLQDLVMYIDPNDVELLQWAGVEEN
jgi:sensor domain CHASE-containing protein